VVDVAKDFDFPWLMAKVVLEGLSILDIPRLEVNSIEEATNFIQAYGYDPSNQEDIKILWKHFDDAVSFIEKTLADPERPKIPEHLKGESAIKDIRRLLLLASESPDSEDQIWSCAVLRVMHVLIHVVHDPRLKYFEQVQNQVVSRLDDYLYVDNNDGAIYLGKKEEGGGIKLLFFKKKDRKDRAREIIKLLHKSETRAEVIYDRIGFRLVTETKFDSIKVVRFLLKKNIISTPNIRPNRSRNWLVDMKRLNSELTRIQHLIKKTEKNKLDLDKLVKRMERKIVARKKPRSIINPQSSSSYRAIQFTCRELVKVKNPMFQVYTRLESQLGKISGGRQILSEVFPTEIKPYEYVFFPYEIQIMDVKSYADSIFGKSNHEEYRRKQLEVARRRTFGQSRKKK